MAKKLISIPKSLGGEKKTPVPSKLTVGNEFHDDGLGGLHVGGVAIEDIDPLMRGRLVFQQTDEGIDEFNRGKVAGAARVLNDESSNAIRRKRDIGLEDPDACLELDPCKELVERYIQPGMHPRFLSKKRLNKEGGHTRGFEIVKDEKGHEITFGSGVLAQMPEELATKRREARRGRGNVAMREIYADAIERGAGLITRGHTPEEMGMLPDRDTDRNRYSQ